MTDARPALQFLTTALFHALESLQEGSKPAWGVMNAQEMTEHLTDFFDISSEKIPVQVLTPEEHLPKYIEFLHSDKEFRENTKAPAQLLGEKPLPLRTASLPTAIAALKVSVHGFVTHFENNPECTSVHPVFGALHFEDWIRLHGKHVRHHLRQFGI